MSPTVTAQPIADAVQPSSADRPLTVPELPRKPLAEEAQMVIPMLKDYEEKLHALSKEAYRIGISYKESAPQFDIGRLLRRNEFDGLKQRYSRIRPAAIELARVVSPMVEHGKLDRITLLELRLRLTDFEHALLTTEEDLKRVEEKMK
jgi:hypothetical protein